MKVLIIGNIRRKQGGITTQIYELRDSLVKEGYEITIVSTHGNIKERIKSLFTAFSAAGRCDLILGVGCAYYGIFPMLVASVVSKVRGRKIVYNFHDGQVNEFINKYSGLLKLFLGKNKIVVATKYLEGTFLKYGFNPVVISNHLNNVTITIRNRRNGKKKIIWARSFEKLYRADIALEGAAKTLKMLDAEFHFYGGGTLKESYERKYGRIDGIIFHDFIPREQLLSEYMKFDIFINTTDYDNFPMSIVEAGMNGLAVLTSDAAGTASIYDSSEVIFFEKGNTGDFREKLYTLISEFEKYEYLIENLGKKLSGFTWESVRTSWMKLLNENN